MKKVPFLPYIIYRTIFQPSELRIMQFQALKCGWHFGEGVEFNESVIADSLELNREIISSGFYDTNAFPGLNGEIQVTVYQDNDYFQFEVSPDNSWSIIHEQAGTEIERIENQNLEQAIDYAKGIKSKLCSALDSYQYTLTGTLTGGDLTTWLLSPTEKMEEFQFLTETAP